jgi:hypothetical protein
MKFFGTLWADIQKLLAFAPVVAAVDPQAAAGIAEVTVAVSALTPTVAAVQAAANGTLDHANLVAGVTAALQKTSEALVAQGQMTATTAQHIAATSGLINAAVAISGLAAPAPTV